MSVKVFAMAGSGDMEEVSQSGIPGAVAVEK
jgi:hypothetical protein